MSIAMIAGGGGFQGLPVLRALHAMGWRVLVADSVAESLNRFEADFFAHVPEARHLDSFCKAIESLVQHYGIEAVFTTTMYDLPVLAKLRPQLEQVGVRVFASSPALVDLLSDKSRAMSAAHSAGLPVLKMVDPTTYDFSRPLIGKPIHGWGGTGMITAADKNTWLQATLNKPTDTYIWQRKIEDFCEWSVDFAVRSDGACSPMVSRRRIRTTGGFAVISQIDGSRAIEELALRTANWLAETGGCGLFNIQFLEEPDGTLWLNDINPRPGTSSVCALATGVNLVDFLLNDDSTPVCSRPGIVIRTLDERFLPYIEQEIKGVVFDLDETLICQKRWMQDKLEIVTTLAHELLEPAQLSSFRLEALRVIDEGPWPQLIDVALARSGAPTSLSAELIKLWRNAKPESVTLHQDTASFLQALQARNIPTALLSDNPAASQKQKIFRLPGHVKFDSIVLTDELSSPKPDTKGFIAVAESLSLPSENLLMVGDSPWRDALGAIRAGYAGALIIKRSGSMSNPLQMIFNNEFPEAASKIIWTDSLYGIDRIFRLSN